MSASGMKIITTKEQKKIMLDMLAYVDKLCRDNGIKYSLIGGSLIGAVRHRGYIPWDDDIDIILTKENYNKLKVILDNETGRYQTLKYGDGGERFPFVKLIDTRTGATEPFQTFDMSHYGIYIDIFCYYPAAETKKQRVENYKKMQFLRMLFSRRRVDFQNRTIKCNLKQAYYNTISRVLGYKRLHKMYNSLLIESSESSDYLISNWPLYGCDKEIQLKVNTEEYVDAKFENISVMIFKNYDSILRTTYGDYTQLPPKSERVSKHGMKMWWREAK